MKKNYFTFFCAIAMMACNTSGKIKSTDISDMAKDKTVVIAHRGAWKNTHLPENSVAAFKAAIAAGYFGSEMDVHMTTDGYIVVNHDPHFHGIDIQNATLADLRQFKLDNGEDLPLLSDFLEVLVKQNRTKLILEIKTSQRGKEWGLQTTKAVVDEVNKYKAAGLTEYISFGFDICQEILTLAPAAQVQYLNGDKTPQEIKDAGMAGIDYHFSVFQRHPEYLSESKKLGLITNAWTVNDPVIMDWLIAHETDYITTNEPELLKERIRKAPVSNGYTLVWSDEFLYSGLPDETKWAYESGGHGWGNNEKQFYTRADTNNAVVKKGSLHIIARHEQKEGADYTSARLVTSGKASWTYGRMEARALLPAGVGLWPAFWMLGNDISEKGWPECGEIDIMEYVGYKPDEVFGTVHTASFNHLKGTQKSGETEIKDPNSNFHIFAIEWNRESISFYLDDVKYHEFKNTHQGNSDWPFDKPFYIILNLAVGGNLGGKEGIDNKAFPAEYIVDYVRVYQR